MSLKQDFKVDFIGLGGSKCASTWVALCLDEHPEICLSHPKDTKYFKTEFHKGLNYYKKCFNYHKSDQIMGEYTSVYFPAFWGGRVIQEEIIERIKNHNPNVKLIVCLRNPIERTYSHYWHRRSRDNTAFLSFEKALKEDSEFIANSLYFFSLNKIFENFPSKNILVLIFEDIQKDSLGFIQNIYKFLGVDPHFTPDSLHRKINPGMVERAKIPYLGFILSFFHYWIHKYRSNLFIKPLFLFLRYTYIYKFFDFIRKWNREECDSILVIEKKLRIPKEKKPPMKLKTREYLRKIFHDDIRNIEKLIGRDLSFWN